MENQNFKTYTFRRMNLKDWRRATGLVLLVLVSVYCIAPFFFPSFFIGFSNSDWLFFIILIFGCSIVIFQVNTRITVDSNGISCKTPIRTVDYPWSSIQSHGIIIKTRSRIVDIPYEEANATYARGFVFGWISTNKDKRRNRNGFIYKDYLDFDFDDEAWKLIEHYRRLNG